ncbi:Atg14 domain-containing protein [Mesoplasma whartonense]|uniref:Atg14 domain-containing protein n=1 Tax=Mesoplasma whartonense TaxID=2878854 RepID=UPI002022A602|nr:MULTISPECIES: Atg14 domain-containing protein [unclassified Mesoplasma]MCL8212676.1 hypothetical protein [Mesoplasma sp. JKS002661]MCL8216415.1 hypothetical protein [Mesoplasma sp. JKS002657]
MDDFEEEFKNIREQNEDKVFSTLIVGNPGMGKTYYLKNKMGWSVDNKLSNRQNRRIKKNIKNLQKENKDKRKEISNLKLDIKDHNDWVYQLEKLIKDNEDKINKLKFQIYRKIIYLNCFEIQNNFSKSIFCEFIQKKIFSRWSRFMYKLNQLLVNFWVYVLVPYLGLIGGLMGIFFGTSNQKYWPIYLIFVITITLLIAVLYNVTYVLKTNFNSRNTNEISNKHFVDFENLIIIFDDLDRLQDSSLKRNITNEISLFRDKMISVFLSKNKSHCLINLFGKKKFFSCSIIAVTNYEEKPVEEINEELSKINEEFEILNRNLKNIEDGIDKIGFYIPSISPNNPHNVGSYFSQRNLANRRSRNFSSILSINYEENLIDFYNKNFDFIYEAAINDLRARDLIYSALKKYEKLNNYENKIEEFFNSQINKNYWELITKKFNVRKINMVFPIIHSLLKSKTNINWLKIIFPDDDFFIYTVIDYAILRVYQPTHFFEQKKQLTISPSGICDDNGEKISIFKRTFYSVEMREIVYNVFSQLIMPERTNENFGWNIDTFKKIVDLFETLNKISVFNLQEFLISLWFKNNAKINEIFLHFFYMFLINKNYFKKIDFFSDSTNNLLNNYSPEYRTIIIYMIRFFVFFKLQNAFDDEYKINNLSDILKINKKIFDNFKWEKKKLIFKFLIGESDQLSLITFSYDSKENVFYTSDDLNSGWFDDPFFREIKKNKQKEIFPSDSIFIKQKQNKTDGSIQSPSWVLMSLFKIKQLRSIEHYDLSLIVETINLEQDKFSDKKFLAAELIDIFSLNDFSKEDYGNVSKWIWKERLFSIFIYMVNKRIGNFSVIEYLDLYEELNCRFSFDDLLTWLRTDWILYREKSKDSWDLQNYQELVINLEQIVNDLKGKND